MRRTVPSGKGLKEKRKWGGRKFLQGDHESFTWADICGGKGGERRKPPRGVFQKEGVPVHRSKSRVTI